MKKLIVIGGGISGLAAAHAASVRLQGKDVDVTVLERDADVGGKALTIRDQGFVVEGGPTGYLDNEPEVDLLVEAAGLTKVPANQASARRFLVRSGRMREIKANPLQFALSGILSPLGLMRVPFEFLVPKQTNGKDESVWDFAARRIGPQGADRLIAPMMLGIFAGDAKQLSLKAALPRLHDIEQQYGSLFKGLLAIKKTKKNASAAGPSGVLTSFPEGLQQLPRQLAARGRFTTRCNAAVQAVVKRVGGGWVVKLEDGSALEADGVVFACEPWAMAALVKEQLPALAKPLDAIYCPPVAVIALGYGPAAFEKVPQGFGVLIPRGDKYRILGCLWDTFLFNGRSPEKKLLLRTMIGGGVDPEGGSMSDLELIDQAKQDLAGLLDLKLQPLYQKVVVWPRAIPQYTIGHSDRVAAVEKELAANPGLFVAGNALYGVAFSKAAVAGLRAGEKAAAYL